MNIKELFKEIFGIATKLLGVFFLYLSFRDVPPVLEIPTLTGYNKTDVISAILPVVFNLAIGWWLVGNKLLIRRAYPETLRTANSRHSNLTTEPEKTTAQPSAQSQTAAKAESTNEKLAALLKKPEDTKLG